MNKANNQKMQVSSRQYYPQLDFVKALAIIAVLVLHTLNVNQLYGISWQFHVQQGVPIFFVVIGITSLITFADKGLYSIAYFRRRFERIIFPFMLTFLVVLFGIAIVTVAKAYDPNLFTHFQTYWG
jgi:peptidoglycan/LPS O-acetylase OafA/YrhL